MEETTAAEGGENRITAFMNTFLFGASGGDVRFVEIFKRLNDVSVTVVTPEQGAAFLKEHGFAARLIITAKDDSRTAPLRSFPLRILGAWRELHGRRDLGMIYASSDLLPDALPAALLRRRGMRYVQVVHHLVPLPHQRQGGVMNNTIAYLMQRLSLYFIKKRADLVIAVSPLTKQSLLDRGFDGSRLFMNPNGIDSAYFDSVIPGPRGYDATFLGRLHATKGIFDAVHIWKEVCKAHPDARLAMIGPGAPKVVQALTEEIRKERMENNIEIRGYLERDAAFRLIKSSKMFIFPSHEEGFGIAILEAMACGVPVVAWNLPVYRDIFHDGMATIPLDDILSFSRNISAWMDDEEGRKRMGRNAKLLSRNYDWNKIASSEREMIMSLCSLTSGVAGGRRN